MAAHALPKGTLVYSNDEAPDRRYWTAYDHFKVEQEARAMRRAYVYAAIQKGWTRAAKRVATALAHAGAQPQKV